MMYMLLVRKVDDGSVVTLAFAKEEHRSAVMLCLPADRRVDQQWTQQIMDARSAMAFLNKN